MLYKYLPPARVDILQNLKIRFTQRPSLNDPFEAFQLINLSDEKDEFLNNALNDLTSLWDSLAEEEKTSENTILYEAEKQKIINFCNDTFNSSKLGANYSDFLNSMTNLGVLSLSRTNTSLLMWSHYTCGNTGYVIGFDSESDFLNQKDMLGRLHHPKKVEYSSKRYAVNLKDPEYYHKLMCVKPLEWAYEEEERVFLAEIDPLRSIGLDEYGNSILLIDYPKASIKEIFIGSRANESLRNTIIDSIKKHEINCKLYASKLSETDYRIEFDEIHLS